MAKRVVSIPGIMGGEPCFEGTRIPASIIAQLIHPDGDMTTAEVVGVYPSLTLEDVVAFQEEQRQERRAELEALVRGDEERRRKRRRSP